jgi:SAM-dependent methyltransferase
MNQGEKTEAGVPPDWPTQLYRKSVMKQARLREIAGLLGPLQGKVCLDVGGDYGALSEPLRRLGGTWHSVDLSDAAVESIRRLVGERVEKITGPRLPFEDGFFDIIVIGEMLERLQGDGDLIAECHRCLKPAGRLIVNVANIKRWAVLAPVRRLFGLTAGPVRPGYSESQLFDLLKDGFDVEAAHTYSRFFVEALDTLAQLIVRRGAGDVSGMKKELRTYSILYPFFQVAAVLDHLLFFSKGYRLIGRARRRQWRERRTPVLADGRSIAEAALGGKIGTAAPF